ncbi:hypothetical protein STEG23_033229, partial [Scotinomys teguina]
CKLEFHACSTGKSLSSLCDGPCPCLPEPEPPKPKAEKSGGEDATLIGCKEGGDATLIECKEGGDATLIGCKEGGDATLIECKEGGDATLIGCKEGGDATLIGCKEGGDATLIGCERVRNATLVVRLKEHISRFSRIFSTAFVSSVKGMQMLCNELSSPNGLPRFCQLERTAAVIHSLAHAGPGPDALQYPFSAIDLPSP